ncbi:hypothetical protein J7J63_05735, partial [Candidatus Bipolaricaulota bacterium]|nr:hypothetical protein [Candidatus Bipolaricaulota bacterium]
PIFFPVSSLRFNFSNNLGYQPSLAEQQLRSHHRKIESTNPDETLNVRPCQQELLSRKPRTEKYETFMPSTISLELLCMKILSFSLFLVFFL